MYTLDRNQVLSPSLLSPIDEPFALWRQRVNKSSKGGDQSRRWREGASDDIEL